MLNTPLVVAKPGTRAIHTQRREREREKAIDEAHSGDRVAAYGPESGKEKEREEGRGRERSICSCTLYSATCHVQGNSVPGSPGEGHGVAIST